MKYLILILLLVISNTALPCNNWISASELEKALNLTPNAKAGCLEGEECYCYDTADFRFSDLQDEIVNGDPIYSSKERELDCADKEVCESLRPHLCADLQGYEFFYAENLILPGYEAYCTKLLGYEQVKTGKKVLKDNPEKKALYMAQLEAEKIKEQEEKLREEKIQKKLRDMAIKEIEKEEVFR